MKANIIKALRNTAETIEIEAGRSARRNFPGVNFDNAALIINGKIAEPDTIIKNGDIVTLRLIPADLTDTPWWVATFFIPFGFIIQPVQLAIKARKEAERAEAELEKIKKLTNQPTIDNSPFLRGATNAISTGKSQPYFCGRNFLTPYLFSKPYYKISGTDGKTQEVYDILELGFKGIIINKLSIGDTVVKTFNNTSPQNGTYSFTHKDTGPSVFEILQDGWTFTTLTELNNKVSSNVINREVIKAYQVQAETAEYLQIQLDPCARDVDICIQFPYGLYKYNDNNDRVSTEVTITPEYSLDGGSTWTQFTFNQNGTQSNVFNRNETKQMRFVAKHTFTLSDYQTLAQNTQNNIVVRVRSNAPDDQKVRADCYVYYYQSVIFDPLKSSSPAGVLDDGGTAGLVPCLNVEAKERAVSCIAGLKMTATENNESRLTQINVIATSTARTWNSTQQEWSETKTATRNPAAIALEILTTDIHPASRYTDAEIDLDAFGAFYEYCETNNLYFDDLITQAQKKDAELQKIADACGVAFYKDIYGRRSVAIDQAQQNSIAVYNPQNIISLTNKKTFERRVDALRIKYISSDNDTYKENTYTVTRLENGQPVTIDENSIIKEITAPGITRQAQIVKYGRRLMAIDELRPVTTTLKIGFEGVYYTPYAKIGIQDPSINRDAQDAVVAGVTYQGGLLKKITLQNPVTFTDPQKNYGVIVNTVNANGAVPVALKVSGTGTTRELTVTTQYSSSASAQPATNNVVSFGELDENGNFTNITHEYVITRIARTDGGFNLDLQEYNEAIYNPGTIPAYKPLVNATPAPAAGAIPLDAVTREELDAKVNHVNGDAIQAAVDTIQNGYRFTNIYNVRPVEDTLEEIIARMDSDNENQSASISMSEEEILIKVEDLDTQQRAYIDLTKDEILAEVDDMARELTGLIDVQAGAVTALVQGGGAAGEMSLSLNLPVMIDATTRAQLITASSEAKVNAVYGLVSGTNYYGIKGNASNEAVKALWNDAIAGGLLASQIVLSADQINIAGKTIYTSGKTDTVATSAADTAAVAKRNDVAQKLGYLDWAAMSTAATLGKTIIDGGHLRTALIEVQDLLAQNITLEANGYIQSSNYAEDAAGIPTAGFELDAANNVINAYGGKFNNINAIDLTLKMGTRFGGYIVSQNASNVKNKFWNVYSTYPYKIGLYNTYLVAGYVTYMANNKCYHFLCHTLEIDWNETTHEIQNLIVRGIGIEFGNSQRILRNFVVKNNGGLQFEGSHLNSSNGLTTDTTEIGASDSINILFLVS